MEMYGDYTVFIQYEMITMEIQIFLINDYKISVLPWKYALSMQYQLQNMSFLP